MGWFPAFFACVLLPLFLVNHQVFVKGQEDDMKSTTEGDGPFIESIIPNDTRIARLAQGKPVSGELPYLESEFWVFAVTKREDEGLGFPDILLSFDVENVGGKAGIYCIPFDPEDPEDLLTVGPANFMWGSNQTQGTDYVFISSNHTVYGTGAAVRFSKETGLKQMAMFLCALWGWSQTSTNFRLELDLDYTKRSLVSEEKSAVKSIFDKCCSSAGCPVWKSFGSIVRGGDMENELPVLDLCHILDNVCDDDGHIIKLSMAKYDLDCDFPLEEIQEFSRLEKLELSHNQLRGNIGEIGGALKDLKKLRWLSAAGNNISGSLADRGVCQLVSGGLEHLKMSHNNLRGHLPPCLFDRNSTLTDIRLDNNRLGSNLPPSFAEDSKLQVLSLVSTSLTGSLPESMSNLVNLKALDLANNNLSGTVPADIGRSPFLTVVDMGQNRLTGPIPESLATNPSLQSLLLANNAFTRMNGAWHTPGALGSELRQVTFRSNSIRDRLPEALLAGNVTILNLENNMFSGPFPALQNMLPEAWNIDVSNNHITGHITDQWADMGLLTGEAIRQFTLAPQLDLSNNFMSGEIPSFLLDSATLPPQLVFTRGINLEGNHFECVPLEDNSTVSHLKGIDTCDAPTEEQSKDPEQSLIKPEETSEAILNKTSGQNGDNKRTDVQSEGQVNIAPPAGQSNTALEGESNEESTQSSTSILVVTIAVIVGLLAIAAMITAFFIRRRWLRTHKATQQSAYSGDGFEVGNKVNGGFRDYGDEDVAVQMFDGKRSAIL